MAYLIYTDKDWFNSIVVRALDLYQTGHGFNYWPLHWWRTVPGKSFNHTQTQMASASEVTTVQHFRNLINYIVR